MIQDVETPMGARLRGTEMFVVGDLNVDLESMVGRGWDEEIAAVVATVGLQDLS